MDPEQAAAGSLIRLARLKAGLTQRELAGQAGVPQPVVSAYETGRRQPTLPTLFRLLQAAGFDLRLRLEPPDTQADAALAWERSRPTKERRRWRAEQEQFAATR